MGTFSIAIDYAPYLVAKEKGWFQEALQGEGIAIEYTTFQSLPPINESFAAGRVDVVFEAEVPAIVGRSAGVDVRFVGISCTLNSNDLIIPTSSPAKSILDLKGKQAAVLAGTGFHYSLIQSIEKSGLSRGDVKIVDMVPPDAKAAFHSGAVQAWAAWPPWAEQEFVAGFARVLPGFNAKIQSIMAVRGSFADDNPGLVEKLVAALDRSKEWVEKNPEEAQRLVAKASDLSTEVVKLAWPKNDWKAQLTPQVIDDMQTKADFLKAEGFIRTGVNVRSDMVPAPDVLRRAPHNPGGAEAVTPGYAPPLSRRAA
jgi:sulfonate transport system substrate-binding protein